ncbi:uncharacterized protein K452DRAFT_288135 [Aplosporella prunicola CBS 121167]|uniref:Uncharacterized protein n=1 Tax=Aplosporella prunicola CBS 121167 TaxID=1176127 RepID=A0A6A6BDS0_9PEZI|nr:uncharacterized protein K452DRAFT_288135 [Aplosporella prunicola CBS 121167]KAF2141435.1 hypothetical protein K452DRAFT_288135 [Aplosporella prunicola CBS 121167]
MYCHRVPMNTVSYTQRHRNTPVALQDKTRARRRARAHEIGSPTPTLSTTKPDQLHTHARTPHEPTQTNTKHQPK